MLKIRLTRRGKKNKAFFRLVLAEHTSPVKGKFIEVLGFVNPHTKEKNFKEDKIKYWIEKGAQCSDSVHNLLVGVGIVKGPKRAIKMKKKPVEETKIEEVKAKEEKKVEEKNEEKKAPESVQDETTEKAPEVVSETENTEKEEETKENLAA